MPQILTITEAQADLAQVITDACKGDEILISHGGQAIVRLAPVPQPRASASERTPQWVIGKEEWARRMASIKALRERAWVHPLPTLEEVLEGRSEGRR